MKSFAIHKIILALSVISCTSTNSTDTDLGEEVVLDEMPADISGDALNAENLDTPDVVSQVDGTEVGADSTSDEEPAASEGVDTAAAPEASESQENTSSEEPETAAVVDANSSMEPAPSVTDSSSAEFVDETATLVPDSEAHTTVAEADTAAPAAIENQGTEIDASSVGAEGSELEADTSSTSSEMGVDSYIVRPGDTLSRIAVKLFGTAAAARALAKANNLENPDLIFPGDLLRIDQSDFKLSNLAMKEETREITVERGDTLSKIAERVLGDSGSWKYIWKLNESKLPDPDRLEPGIRLSVVVQSESGVPRDSH